MCTTRETMQNKLLFGKKYQQKCALHESRGALPELFELRRLMHAPINYETMKLNSNFNDSEFFLVSF